MESNLIPAELLEGCKGSRTPIKVARNVKLAQDHCAGLTIDEIANKHHLSTRQVHRILQSDEAVKLIIDDVIRTNITTLHKAVKQHDNLIDDDDVENAVRLRAIDLRYKITGVTPTHSTHPIVQQISVTNHITVGDQETKPLQDYAKFKLLAGLSDDIVDAEVED